MNSEPLPPEDQKSSLRRIHEELARNGTPESAEEKLQPEGGPAKLPEAGLQRLRGQGDTSWVAKSFGLVPDGRGAYTKPYEPEPPGLKELVARALAPREPEEIKRWARQIQENPGYYEKLVGYVVGPKVAATLVEQFLAARTDEKRVVSETQAVATQAAGVVLEEPTLESAYQALNRFLRNLSPVQQFILSCILMPLLTSLVSDHLNPVVKRLWIGSPQGIQKEANNQMVAAVGGTSLLVDYRLVVTKTLAVSASPKAAGKKVASLQCGAAVRVLRIEGAFALVEWKGQGGVVINGWVFKRYLKPFL